MKKSKLSIFCVDSAADYIQKLYRLKNKPIVLRNIPYKWTIDQDRCSVNRKKFLESFNLKSNPFICLYHGIIGEGRGIETLIRIIPKVEGAILFILGMGEKKYLNKINEQIQQEALNKVFIIPAVEPNLLKEYLCVADVGMVVIPALIRNNYYMLPNKFFENIQAENPIICSNFPEVSKIINTYQIGLTVNPENMDELTKAINTLKTNQTLYQTLKLNTKRAKEDLCWEKERKILINAYSKMLE